MAIVTNAHTTAAAKGIREDLSDQIHRVDVEDTPFISAIGSKNATNTVHDWQTEALDAVDTANKHIEGDQTARAAANVTVRLQNVCQISKRNATVSGTLEATNRAGRNQEMARQMALRTIVLRKDMEAILLSNQAFSTSEARTTRGIEAWLRTNTVRNTGASGADPADPVTTPATTATDGTQRAFTEAMLKDVLQQIYTAGGTPKIALMGPYNKQVASTFTGRTTSRQNTDARTIGQATNLYDSDFGPIKFVTHRYLRSGGRSVLCVDPSYAKVAYLRKFRRYKLGRIGDAETNEIISEFSLEMCNERAHGIIADLTTSA